MNTGTGRGWESIHSPNPRGFSFATLNGVSCPSTTSCFAVGEYAYLGAYKTLVERWNGSSWAIVPSPNPAATQDYTSGLHGVACPSAASCVAVGNFNGRSLVEHWNGRVWSIMNGVPISGEFAYGPLYGVSCTGVKSCFAVGVVARFGVAAWALVEHWNGRGGWSVMASALSLPSLDGVSCPSTTSCFAVGPGQYVDVERKLLVVGAVQHWNGRVWSLMTAQSPITNGLDGVSCPSRTSCFAAGGSVEEWEGRGGWMSMPSPKEPDLFGIVCPSPTQCIAVGQKLDNRPLAEQYGY